MMRAKWVTVAVISLVAWGCFLRPPSGEPGVAAEGPDYSDEANWAALPDREDEADRVAAGESDGQATAKVDVFFVHPTTYYKRSHWNQPLDDEGANRITDEGVMRNQASAFNGVGRVYAPRYRQMALTGFTVKDKSLADEAMEIAYRDVARAFRYYLEEWGADRPLILASHSQGTYHMVRLVNEFLSGPENEELRERLVAVYAIGGPIPLDAEQRVFPEIDVCASPDETGCLVSYNSYRVGRRPDDPAARRAWYPTGWEEVDGATICVNPVTWRRDGEKSKRAEHQGAVRFEDDDLNPEPDRQWLEARCAADGGLDVELVGSNAYGFGTGGASFHLVDYALFYIDIRRNAKLRVSAWR